MSDSLRAKPIKTIDQWYRVYQLDEGTFLIDEPTQVKFFLLKEGNRGLFIDTGLGLNLSMVHHLIEFFDLHSFDVINTHAHCDHIGFNSLAKKVFLHEIEWKKYLDFQDEKQISTYYSLLQGLLLWPKGELETERTRPWQANAFVKDQEIFEFQGRRLLCLHIPGHTAGHMAYWDVERGYFFCGDFLYEGSIFLTLPDSSLTAYEASMDKVLLLSQTHTESSVVFYPSHFKVPISLDYLLSFKDFLKKVKEGTVPIEREWEGNSLFAPGVAYNENNHKVILKKSDLPVL